MPAFIELYKEVHGKLPAGATWDALNWLTNQTGEMTFVALAPPNTPPAALRRGYDAASNDPQFIAQSTATNGMPYSFVGVERGSAIFRALAGVSPNVLDTLRKTIEPRRP